MNMTRVPNVCAACMANNHVKSHDFQNGCQCACHLPEWIEAERNTWHWTNDEHTEARNGRWVAVFNDRTHKLPEWGMKHDDFPDTRWWSRPEINDSVTKRIASMFDSFLTWHAAQNQPAEPTEFGYVGTVTCADVPWQVWRTKDGYTIVNERAGVPYERKTWADVLDGADKFEAATR